MADKLLLLNSCNIMAGAKELANRLSKFCESWDKEIVIVGILKGCVWFYSDLTRFLPKTLKFTAHFVEYASYKGQTQNLQRSCISICKEEFVGKKVVLVDELYDNGTTFEAIKQALSFIPREDIITVCLMRKDKVTKTPLPDLCAFVLPNVWLVGYGLDDNQHFRHWKNVYAYKKLTKGEETPGDDIFYNETFYEHVLEDINEAQMNW